MPVHPDTFAPGTPCWADVLVDDLGAARQFYGGLFGWTFEDLPAEAGGYVMARKNGHVVAGALARNPDDPGQVNAWTLYLATDDVDAVAARATAAGGVFFLGPLTVLDVGRIAVGADPAGAAYGLWQARQHTGADLVDEPGSLCWAETMSRNYDASRTFYADVFGFQLQEIGEGDFRYCVASLDDDGRPIGGIGEIPAAAPAEVPSHWMVYFAVESCDDAARRVVELGGSVLQQPFDTPYGRMAVVAGPQGETFSIMRPASPNPGSGD
ncbi:VOC family protein [Humibacillus xanthopallidus]|uniref:VOC family protein n=1 Tax=Humibacillus xanthopallidus TaxID=412689 RepID=UPI003850D8AA